MRFIRKLFLFLIILAAICYATTSLMGINYIYKEIIYNYVNIDDYKIFYNRTVKTDSPHDWSEAVSYNKKELTTSLRHELDTIQTVAFLVLKNDSVCYEEYWDGYNKDSYSNSFSMSKSIVSILTGIAVDEGKIKSLDDPIRNYWSDISKQDIGKISFRNLLMMAGGTDWDESYSAVISTTSEAYYGTDLECLVKKMKLIHQPGTLHYYKSGETQLLAISLEHAVGKSLSDYASEKLWKPIGATHDAIWSLDHNNGTEKAYCCFNTNARDFARIGDLYLHHGNWFGKQIVSEQYVQQSLTPINIKDETGKTVDYYGYQWWILPDREGVFYARGILGQFIIVVPNENMVIVRLGNLRGPEYKRCFKEVYDMIDWASENY